MSITKATRDVLDLSVRAITSITITGGSINGTPIGATTPSTGAFTNLNAVNLVVNGTINFSGATITGGVLAQYGDLAERYESDQMYPAGTLVRIGGKKEITVSGGLLDVFGVVASNPAITMNAEQDSTGGYMLPVALVGRVPVNVHGDVKKGDRIYQSIAHYGTGVAGSGDDHKGRAVIGRALEDKNTADIGLVMCAVRVSL